jgi:hypothetical protein
MSNAKEVKETIANAIRGDSLANKLFFNRHTKSWCPTNSSRNPDAGLSITNRETIFSA